MEFVKLGGTLGGITFLVVLMLSVSNAFTKDIIANNLEKERLDSMKQIMDCDEIVKVSETIYEAQKGGKLLGHYLNVMTKGYGGDIEMMVGISTEQKVTGVRIISSSETPGLGANASSPEFLKAFQDKTHPMKLGDIDAISGATITSEAVVQGVNLAFEELSSKEE